MKAGGSEKKRLNESLVEVSKVPLTLCWRNNTGMAWQGEQAKAGRGQQVTMEPGMIILRNARPVTFGLPGSPDIIGLTSGRAWGIEQKDDVGRQSPQQVNFQTHFERCGGLYLVSRSAVESRVFIDAIRRGEK